MSKQKLQILLLVLTNLFAVTFLVTFIWAMNTVECQGLFYLITLPWAALTVACLMTFGLIPQEKAVAVGKRKTAKPGVRVAKAVPVYAKGAA